MSDESDGRYGRRIVDVCDCLHTSITGSADPIQDEDRERMVVWLMRRRDEWHLSHWNWKPYDDAIHALIQATLAEVYAHEFLAARVRKATP